MTLSPQFLATTILLLSPHFLLAPDSGKYHSTLCYYEFYVNYIFFNHETFFSLDSKSSLVFYVFLAIINTTLDAKTFRLTNVVNLSIL